MPRDKTPQTDPVEPQPPATGLQTAVTVFIMGMMGMVVTTAIYAPKEYSDRAFRIIDKFKRDPEPAPEEDTPPIRRRTPRK